MKCLTELACTTAAAAPFCGLSLTLKSGPLEEAVRAILWVGDLHHPNPTEVHHAMESAISSDHTAICNAAKAWSADI